MNGIVPMEVGEQTTSTSFTSNEALLNNCISAMKTASLKYSIPVFAGSNEEEWTAKQQQEVHRRKGEDMNVKTFDSKIEIQMMKLKQLVDDRNSEVHRINKRRSQHDNKLQIQRERKEVGKKIKKRKRDEADEKEKRCEEIETKKKKEELSKTS
ncbi:hypothetical protein B9Z55_012555 [Caenorhabditis nigoni]|uniref:Uncharacterized protein n=2 Tax=Caenorhabditis nigoni TaxID=1611254 RepID=A0A2G5TXN9_9PELO|nr:hypothetical protein B9Z55_012545 [Caenorhabditis nigoni]PIC32080.1 hypothetical protein B9Z55_012551 [Caenorhabditis nigoni]PIC32089.1 hypothetical protein B9Z55_012555 [Caenorhabditis nigoni]